MSTVVTVEYQVAWQGIEALRAAAYRMIGTAHCSIEQVGDKWVCTISPAERPRARNGPEATSDLQGQFRDFVTDENLRQQIEAKTEGIRNVVLALAFGSLAKDEGRSE